MKSERSVAGWWLIGALCGALVAIGCGGGSKAKPDGGDGGVDAKDHTDVAIDIRPDGGIDGGDGGGACATSGAPRGPGEACECGAQCYSGFCAEGVCCDQACGEACKTCKAAGRVGQCVARMAGDPPRVATACAMSSPSSCGTDGTCDGAGGCRKYGSDTQCMSGSCEGDQVIGGYACNGTGQCRPGATKICAPFSCNGSAGMCYAKCTNDSQCVSGHKCVDGLCGLKMNGAACTADSECASTHCADGVCCNVACNGACNSCNLNQKEGTCWPVAAGRPDPRGRCKDEGAASCGTNGTCDGLGSCAKYPRETICVMPSCSDNRLNTAGTCNGVGTCRAPSVRDCPPFRCVNGACTTACQGDADCAPGIACVKNTCGPKQDGQACTAASQCKSNQCVDGVCCESSCEGGCRSCALPSSPGKCVALAAGEVDTRHVCVDAGAASCQWNGKCDGSGGCQRYVAGTLCADEKCQLKVYTPPSTCNGTGECVTPDQQSCNPYVCNGNKCFSACASDAHCQAPNSCVNSSCGKKPDGAACSSADECEHNFCQQGICCGTACAGPCRSCALSGSLGTCTNVPTGTPDPAEMCGPDPVSSCARNGRCEGGGCQRYAAGTACKDPGCPTGTTTFTGVSSCDGAGKCVTPGTTSCFPFLCGAGACRGTCTTDAQCASPAVCINGSCGLKPNGAICTGGQECLSQICEQGVCCSTTCRGTCKSCALPNARGACTNVPTGDTDPQGTCKNQGAASCKTDGFCDGAGACRLYDASTSCAAPSCPAGQATLTSGRTCDGKGTCQAASSIACDPYVCNGTTACRAACASDADCLPVANNICDKVTSRCGNKRRLGQTCSSTTDCLTGNTCVDGVCCSTSACPLCQACNVAGSAGNCANLPINTPAPSGCAPNPPCGNTGACNGLGACQQAGTTASCGTISCTGSTYTPLSHCNGSGACAAATTASCSPYNCASGGICKTSCAGDADCVAPFTCQGSGTSRSCALKPNGQVCSAANQCISGFCTDGVCCGSQTCPTCQACNVSGQAGSCAPLPAGTPAPGTQCTAAPPCGNTGTCNGAGACTQQSSTLQCLPPSCSGSTFTAPALCTGAGTCGTQTTSSCSPYVCSGTTSCRTTCNTNSDCISTAYYCTGTGGSCLARKAAGATCGGGNECTSGNCVDGVCCGSPSCPTCQACNVTGSAGTCANIPAGGGDLHGGCPTGTTCGNTGTCNGAGACTQAASSTSCGAASCTGSTYTAPVTCSGTGTCPTAMTSSCSPYTCGVNSCRTSCNANTDCINSSYYCTGTGGSCLLKKGSGQSCATANECSSGNCVDGVCCTTSSCGACHSCALSGDGTCAPVPNGMPDPNNRCAAAPPCGNTGVCQAGACQQAAATVSCGAAMCSTSTFQPAAFCTGTGTCAVPAAQNCSPRVCTPAGCRTDCNLDTDCVAGNYCTGPGGSCVARRTNGQTCTGDSQCASTHCTNGVCCGSAVCPSCQSCAVALHEGSCWNVAAGTSDGSCLDDGAASCGNDGKCDGNGSCELYPATTVCSQGCNADNSEFNVKYCDGGGLCSTVLVSFPCASMMCDSLLGCLL